MSASPRKLIRRALDALEQVEDVIARYPEARGDLERRLGADLLARTLAARATLAEAAEVLDQDASSGGATSAGP